MLSLVFTSTSYFKYVMTILWRVKIKYPSAPVKITTQTIFLKMDRSAVIRGRPCAVQFSRKNKVADENVISSSSTLFLSGCLLCSWFMDKISLGLDMFSIQIDWPSSRTALHRSIYVDNKKEIWNTVHSCLFSDYLPSHTAAYVMRSMVGALWLVPWMDKFDHSNLISWVIKTSPCLHGNRSWLSPSLQMSKYLYVLPDMGARQSPIVLLTINSIYKLILAIDDIE